MISFLPSGTCKIIHETFERILGFFCPPPPKKKNKFRCHALVLEEFVPDLGIPPQAPAGVLEGNLEEVCFGLGGGP